MPRLQVDDLRRGEIQPRANPVDNFQYVHGTKLNFTDFSELSATLTNGLANLELGGAERDQELGAAELEKRLGEAEASSGSLAEAFAKVTNKGVISEFSNPYFRTGYIKALAREIAARGYGEASSGIKNGFT